MHSKHQGSIGEIKVAYELLSLGYPVFCELGDLSTTDLITLVGSKPIKIQVKCYNSKNGVVQFKLEKSGPNYRFSYNHADVDLFVVHVLDKNITLYFGWDKLIDKRAMSFRVEPTRNGQTKGVNMFTDYTDFGRALRDYTQYISASNVGDDERVQTTT